MRRTRLSLQSIADPPQLTRLMRLGEYAVRHVRCRAQARLGILYPTEAAW
jgi:hypothetical protein